MRFQIIRSFYPENVSRFAPSSSLKWYSVGRIHLASTFFSCLDTRKEGKRKSRPLPRPGKLAGYMMEIENVMRFGLLDRYISKTYHVLRIRHPWDVIR